ncbi:MAG TPA: P-loop NTPase fold protein [Magnetospirillaceae bacterium]|nr:P-loop NTPase fold protein [Magnetospirillaceae bacterium]
MFYRKQSSLTWLDSSTNLQGDNAGRKIETEIQKLVTSIARDNETLLASESFVIAIYGAWGTGKTFASKRFLQVLKENSVFNDEKTIKTFVFDLLSFGNITESVSNVLTEIGAQLFADGIADVRDHLRQMVLDATPSENTNAALSIMGVTISKNIQTSSKSKDNKSELKEQFKGVVAKGHRLVIVLDDLDRMKPNEIMIVLRMVENFREIPGVIFLLPFNKASVTNGISDELKLDQAAGYVFLRKFIKASLTIQLDINDLRNSFTCEFTNQCTKINAVDHFGISLAETCWYFMLHTILTRDTIDLSKTDNRFPASNIVDQNLNQEILNPARSGYLHTVAQHLIENTPRDKLDKDFFLFEKEGDKSVLAPFYAQFPGLHRADQTLIILDRLVTDFIGEPLWVIGVVTDTVRKKYIELEDRQAKLNKNNQSLRTNEAGHTILENNLDQATLRLINLNTIEIQEISKQFEIGPEIPREERFGAASSQPSIFEYLLLPALQKAEKLNNDSKLTDYFSRRDMEQLASAFAEAVNSEEVPTDKQTLVKKLINISVNLYREFR